VVEMTRLAADEVRRFGIQPRIALLSHSSFGTDSSPTAEKMRKALVMLHTEHPDLDVEGEMHGDAALDAGIRKQVFPNAKMGEDANLLIFPTLDAANIAFNLLKTAAGEGMTIGPILLGSAKPVHILTATATVRRIINMTALTVVEAGR
jgi:malate dehydrogenase (oxaloacetate-decarboxylating)(NADP+)